MSGERERIAARLAELKDETANAIAPSGFWLGDTAGERRLADDQRAGRLLWRAAHCRAVDGLEALDRDDLEFAAACREEAEELYAAALKARLGAKGIAALGTSAKRRDGCPPDPKIAERNRLLAETADRLFAEAAAEGRRLTLKKALDDAVRGDPVLAGKFDGMNVRTIFLAYHSGKICAY